MTCDHNWSYEWGKPRPDFGHRVCLDCGRLQVKYSYTEMGFLSDHEKVVWSNDGFIDDPFKLIELWKTQREDINSKMREAQKLNEAYKNRNISWESFRRSGGSK